MAKSVVTWGSTPLPQRLGPLDFVTWLWSSGSGTHSASSHACPQAGCDRVSWLLGTAVLLGSWAGSCTSALIIGSPSVILLPGWAPVLRTILRPWKPQVLPWTCHCLTGSRGSPALPVAGAPTCAVRTWRSPAFLPQIPEGDLQLPGTDRFARLCFCCLPRPPDSMSHLLGRTSYQLLQLSRSPNACLCSVSEEHSRACPTQSALFLCS